MGAQLTSLSIGQSVLVDRSLRGKIVALVPGHRNRGRQPGLLTVYQSWQKANQGQPEMLKSQRTFESWNQVPTWDSAMVEIPPPAHSGRKPTYKLVTMGRIEVVS